MPQAKTTSRAATTAKSRPATKKAAASRKRPAAASAKSTATAGGKRPAAASRKPPATPSKPKASSPTARTAELSEDVFKSLEDGAKSAIEAVREFLDTVDKTLPVHSEGHSKREEITDSALQMAERLVHTQYEFLRKVVDSAGKSMTGSK
jgi:hypothetical protein